MVNVVVVFTPSDQIYFYGEYIVNVLYLYIGHDKTNRTPATPRAEHNAIHNITHIYLLLMYIM
jgi:hypothetical protein